MNGLCKVLLASLLFAWPAWAVNEAQPEAWDLGIYEAKPADGDTVGQGDDHMRTMKIEIRERLEVEHHFGEVTADDVGLHRLGSGRCFFQATAPTDIEQQDHESGGGAGVSQLDTDSTAATNNPDGDDEIVGMGRCWIDSDDNSFHIYTNDAGAGVAGWAAVQEGNINLLDNGSFEMRSPDCEDFHDAGGPPQTTGAADGNCDNDGVTAVGFLPTGWTLLLTPTYTIQQTDNTAAGMNGVGNSFTATAVGAANEGLQQTLEGLRINTVYKIQARVDAGAGADECSLTTALAGTNAALTTTTNAWETLVGTFTTDASADVTVQLESDVATDICEWDHVSVTELSTPFVPERVYDRVCVPYGATSPATEEDIEGLRLRFRNPWPKAVVMLGGHLFMDTDGGIVYWMRDTDAAGAVRLTYIRETGDGGAGQNTVNLTFMDDNLTPGSEYVYSLDITLVDVLVDPTGVLAASPDAPDHFCVWLEAYPL